MHIVPYLAVLSLVSIEGFAAALPRVAPHVTPRSLQRYPFSRRDLPVATVQKELGPLLSNTSSIIGPDSPSWANDTERYNIYTRPDVEVVVVPGEEKDVSAIVSYCNDNSIDFLAYGRGHGFTTTLRGFKGLQINLGQLKGITIAKDRKSVLLQGGLDNGQVQEALWPKGYVTASGTATCVGLMGAGLGGGHGVYEGQYGLVADNFLHLNVVLANGSAIGVNETSHPELWWAMRGAGHNFGIVTSAKMKLYPRKIDTWHYHNYWWTGDKLETVLTAINKLAAKNHGSSPPLLGFNAGQYAMNSSISKTEAALFWSFAYAGPAGDAEKLLAPFNAIEAVDHKSGDTPLPNLANSMTASGEGGSCVPQRFIGASTVTGPYNITAQRRIYDLYNRKAAEYPELAAASQIYNEGYSTKAMEEVPGGSTAYPHRDKKHIIFILFALAEGSDLQDAAREWSKETWDLWLEGEGHGAKPATYVNYVLNNPWETQNSIYGDEQWRLKKLTTLKEQYDPFNRFRYYAPIIPAGN